MAVGDERLSVMMVRGYECFELTVWYYCRNIGCRGVPVLIPIGLLVYK